MHHGPFHKMFAYCMVFYKHDDKNSYTKKSSFILRNVSVVCCPYNGRQWAPMFGYQHSNVASENTFHDITNSY